MPDAKYNNKTFFSAFGYAWNGLLVLFRERNVPVYIVIACCAVIAGFVLKISAVEWIAIALAIGLVFAAEAFNTALEKLADHVSTEKNKLIGAAKDLAAAGVLIIAIIAIAVGLIIFIPKVF